MGKLHKDQFICLDCETTGLDTKNDRIIEIALICFSFEKTFSSYETLVNPCMPIPKESQDIHNISQEMVEGKPTIQEVLPNILKSIGSHILVGHAIAFDISIICEEAKRHQIPCTLHENAYIDTLRLARLYGDSPINSLETLRKHFNIEGFGAHRAKNDVLVNIEVFKRLVANFQTTEEVLQRLKRPIALKTMPLGKHKGRAFSDVPIEYLQWAVNKDFDQDLLYSIRLELKNRKKGNTFQQASNPFSSL